MKIVFFDTETTGLVDKNQKVLSKQPHIVQRAHIVEEHTSRGTSRGEIVELFNPGVSIPRSASDVHGITDKHVEDKPLFTSFLESHVLPLLESADVIIAHNASYDMNVLYFEAMRISTPHNKYADRVLDLKQKVFCTMKETTDICKVPSKRGFKWPTLQELHIHCFGIGFTEAHDALVDIKTTASCFHHLLGNGTFVLEDGFVKHRKPKNTFIQL